MRPPHHGRGRPTRRRGFDDDFSYDRAPSGDGPRYPSSSPQAGFGPELDATVKWFNPDKGFGFVALADGSGDVFLHANALTNAGHGSVSPGASLRVRVGQGQKGRQVMEVLAVDEGADCQESTGRARAARSPSPHPGDGPALAAAVEKRGTVKWYNATKGFGFVAISDSGKDVFVHASALQRSGVPQLVEGQTVWVDVVQGAKGPEAASVRAV